MCRVKQITICRVSVSTNHLLPWLPIWWITGLFWNMVVKVVCFEKHNLHFFSANFHWWWKYQLSTKNNMCQLVSSCNYIEIYTFVKNFQWHFDIFEIIEALPHWKIYLAFHITKKKIDPTVSIHMILVANWHHHL